MKKILIFIVCFLIFSVAKTNLAYSNSNILKRIFEQAELSFNNGDYSKSIQLFEKCLEIYPKFPQVYNYLGLAYKISKTDADKAVEMFKKSIELDPEYIQAYDNLAKMYYGMGNFEEAKFFALKAIEVNPNFITGHLTLAWIYLLGFSSPSDAIVHFETAIKKNKLPYAYFGLGLAYFMDGQRLKVFDMITLLRKIQNEGLALKLEAIVRNRNFKLPDEIGPLIMPQVFQDKTNENFFNEDYSSLTEEEVESELKDAQIKVRVRRSSSEEPGYKNSDINEKTGLERIKELQNNEKTVDF